MAEISEYYINHYITSKNINFNLLIILFKYLHVIFFRYITYDSKRNEIDNKAKVLERNN